MADDVGELAPKRAEEIVNRIDIPIRRDIADAAVNYFNATPASFRSELDAIKTYQEPLYHLLSGIVDGEDKLLNDKFPRHMQFARGALTAYKILSEELGDDMPKISHELIDGFARSDQERLGDNTGVEVRVEHGSQELPGENAELNNAIERLDNTQDGLNDAKYGAYIVYGLVKRYMSARNINRAVHGNLSKL